MTNKDFYEELYEDYNDMIKKYCLATLICDIRKGEDGFFFDGMLSESFFIMAGLFPEEMVQEAFEDFDFEGAGIDKEGCWEIRTLMSYSPQQTGDEGMVEVRAYLCIDHQVCLFIQTFEERDKQEAEMKDFTDLFGNKTSNNDY